MKKFIALSVIFVFLFATGCSKKKDAALPTSEKEIVVSNTDELGDNEFISMVNSNTRPLAVMIDNDGPSSRPQIGLESAYIIYEVIVEGGASRIMAIFRDDSIEKVGPIRSSRHYFLDYALEHDAMYLHAGWSPKATQDISSLKVNNINGILGDDGSIFYRDTTYDNTYHNLYTNVADAYEYADGKKKYRTTSDIKYNWYNSKDKNISSGTDALEVGIPYSSLYKVNYKYNEDTKLYERYIGSSPHMSQTGDGLTTKNIIICHVRNYALNDGENKDRQEIETVGSGSGYYITNGKAQEITWSKSQRTARTVYKDLNGNEIKLNIGNTYIQIVPKDAEITIK